MVMIKRMVHLSLTTSNFLKYCDYYKRKSKIE